MIDLTLSQLYRAKRADAVACNMYTYQRNYDAFNQIFFLIFIYVYSNLVK